MRHQGYSATELLIVTLVIGIIAAVAVPRFSASDAHKLDFAATRVAEAIRFARSESMRTGQVHGATINQDNQQVRVETFDLTSNPVSGLVTLRHPITKQLYDFDFDTEPTTLGVQVSNSQDAFDYPGHGRVKTLLFEGNGIPMWIVAAGPTTYNLGTGTVELSMAGVQRTVQVAPYTGRVAIQ